VSVDSVHMAWRPTSDEADWRQSSQARSRSESASPLFQSRVSRHEPPGRDVICYTAAGRPIDRGRSSAKPYKSIERIVPYCFHSRLDVASQVFTIAPTARIVASRRKAFTTLYFRLPLRPPIILASASCNATRSNLQPLI
jgi:hypothetical protein